jgi:hypothetical protein
VRAKLVGLVMLLGCLLGSGAQAGELRQVRYVAGNDFVPGGLVTGVADELVSNAETPVGRLGPNGAVYFTPSGTRFSVRIDDLGVEDGETVEVHFYQYLGLNRGKWIATCVPVRTPTVISGFRARTRVRVYIDANTRHPYTDSIGCTGQAVGGVVSLRS